MPNMSCPRCGLTVALRAPYLTLERCPRCIAKARIAVPMVLTAAAREQSSSLVIRTERGARALILRLYGELDLASAPVLEQQLHDAQALGVSRIVVNLRRLEFIDSAGLHVLLNAHRRLSALGQELLLRRGPRAVQRMFELTETVSVLRFED